MSNPIIKQTLHYLSGNVIAKCVQFLSLLIFTRIVSPSDYGTYSIFISYATVFTILLTLNSHTAVSRYVYERKNDIEEFTGATFICTIVLMVFFSCVLLVGVDQVSDYINLSSNYIILFVPLAAIEFITSLYIQILQPARKSKEIAVLLISKAILSLLCSVTLAEIVNDKLGGIVYGYVIGNVLALTLVGLTNRLPITLSISLEHTKYIYTYTLPLIAYAITTIILNQADKLLIAKISGNESAGLYALASNISMITVVIYGAMLNAWTPSYYERMNSGSYEILQTEAKRIFLISSLTASALALFGSDVGVLIFPNEFQGGLTLIPVLILAYYFDLGWQIYGRHFGYIKKNYYITAIGVTSSAVNLFLNYILIQHFGYYGAAFGTVLAYALMLFLTIFTAKYITRVHPYPFSIMYGPFFLVFAASGASLLIGSQLDILLRLVIKLMIFFVIFRFVSIADPTVASRIKSLLLLAKRAK